MKKIFITGVSSGIGHALAEAYLHRDCHVFGISRRTSASLAPARNFSFQELDLSEEASIRAVLPQLLGQVDSLDLVILNAGILGKSGDVCETSVAEFQRTMNINVWANKIVLDSIFSICPNVKQVVAISSAAAVASFRGSAAYCISKAALNMLIAMYAEEQKRTHFNSVAPCLVKTEMQDELASQPADPRFPAFDSLRLARQAGLMIEAPDAAEYLISVFEKATARPSGSFIDASSAPRPSLLRRLNPLDLARR